MTTPLVVDPIRRRRIATSLRVGLATAWAGAALVTHLPSPSGSGDDPATREAVRGIWVMAAETARQLGAWVPDLIVEVMRPIAGDKVIHVALSFALAWLWLAARAVTKGTSRRATLAVIGVLVVYAAVGEITQGMTGRIADVGDVIANAAGAVLAAGAIHVGEWWWRRYWMPSSQPKTMPISASSSA